MIKIKILYINEKKKTISLDINKKFLKYNYKKNLSTI